MLSPHRHQILPGYAELVCRSNFSFLTGASHPKELVARAQALGYWALAITDECSVAGVVRAHEEAEASRMRLIIGTTMRLSLQEAAAPPGALSRGGPRLALLAQSRRGYSHLVRWITLARGRAPKGQYQALMSDLEGRAPTAPTLAGLPDCFALLLPESDGTSSFESLLTHATWLKTWLGPERCALALPRLRRQHDADLIEALKRVSALSGLRIVAVGDVLMHARSRKPLQDALTATRLRRTVSECGFALEPNAEAHLRTRMRLSSLYRPQWLEATLEIAASCLFSLNELRYEYPREIVPEGHTPASWLRTLTEEGLLHRFPKGTPDSVRATIEHELALIARMNYEAYFLTVADLVRWARSRKIICQGRGSAANSVVCYALRVTEVDPGRASLLFERFISVERNEPPDIDIDFEHQRREEVIQYIYKKYGRHRAALTAVVSCYRPRSALRDMGRALGFDLDRIDAVAKSQHWFDGRSIDAQRLRENGFDPAAPLCKLWTELTAQLINFPRHLSQHPGGFVIARDDLAELVPVENAAMENRSVIQWDKDDLDTLRLLKVDVLALGMLSAQRRSCEYVAAKLGRDGFDVQEIPPEDGLTYDMLCRGDSVGVFQVESRAQMSMLPRLQPRNYYDLVIEVAIVRPGPIQGGMVHPYLKRRSKEEAEDYPSEEVKVALKRTLGVPIFQEQVMQLAMLAADFTGGEADQLRRAMAAWKRKGGLAPFYDKLVGRMVAKGYDPEFAERIFKQIQGFGEYGFPESHAASFALIVYNTAWLKRHHPDAFLAGLLNSQPMGFYAPAQLVRDARAHGVHVLPVDVNRSDWDSLLEADVARSNVRDDPNDAALAHLQPVRLGFSRVSGFPQAAAERIVSARAAGPWASAEDLARRAQLDAHHLGLLARANALAVITGHRHQAAWAVAGIDTRAPAMLRASRTHEAVAELQAPALADTVFADYRATGLSLEQHPLALLRSTLLAYRVQTAAVLAGYPNGRLARASGLITHRQRPGTAKGVIFVTLEDETGVINVIVWPQLAEAQRRPLLASSLLTVFGIWQCQGEVRHLVARKLIDHSSLLQGLATKSRNFR